MFLVNLLQGVAQSIIEALKLPERELSAASVHVHNHDFSKSFGKFYQLSEYVNSFCISVLGFPTRFFPNLKTAESGFKERHSRALLFFHERELSAAHFCI